MPLVSAGRVVGLFAGIGGLEVGLEALGWRTELLCDIDPAARAVLAARFPDVEQCGDIRSLRALPAGVDLVTAGFPCQDLSQAGMTAGIRGAKSSVVDEVFRLISRRRGGPRWLLLENVPFMLQLDRGRAMGHLTTMLADLGFAWAYRVVDARAFGLPQRRLRVILLASRSEDPRPILFSGNVDPPTDADPRRVACGFYWTEGTRGLGWAVDATPTLKGGSSIGIASPPAVRTTDGSIVTPGITDAERLQGFPAGWTEPALRSPGVRAGHRWRLVGNAVSTRMSRWIGEELARPGQCDLALDDQWGTNESWPMAGWGKGNEVRRVHSSRWPVRLDYEHLAGFLRTPTQLSARATAGFLKRARSSRLRFEPGFLDDVERHLLVMGGRPGEAA